MPMRTITASQVERATACHASMSLQAAHTSGAASERGITVHAFVAAALVIGREAALSDVPLDSSARALCEQIDIDMIRGLTGDDAEPKEELAMSFDPVTGIARELGKNIGRAYGDSSLIYGTGDIISHNKRFATVIDFKTGLSVAKAAVNWQMRTLAVMASRAYKVDQVRVALVYLKEGEDPYVDAHVFEAMDLDGDAAALSELHKRVSAVSLIQNPDVSPGSHCKYCPAAISCPANTKLVKALPSAVSFSEAINHLILDPKTELTLGQLGSAYEQLIRYRDVIDQMVDGIKNVAITYPVPLPNGKRLELVRSERDSIDADMAHDILPKGVADAAFELATSKAAIKRVFGKQSAEMLRKLRVAGAIKTTTTETVKEVR